MGTLLPQLMQQQTPLSTVTVPSIYLYVGFVARFGKAFRLAQLG